MFKVIFAYAIELRLNYFSIITVMCDISKQTEQRARIAKIFAPWHLAIAITSNKCIHMNPENYKNC